MIDDFDNQDLGLVLQKNIVSIEFLPSLGKKEVHLWCIPLELDSHQAKQAKNLLSQHQRDKFERRNSEKLKNAYLASRFYLSSLLAAYAKTPIDQLKLQYSRLNKPFIVTENRLQFNFTDTFIDQDQAVGLYAFTLEKQIGVDVESIHRQGDFTKILARRFSDAEIARVETEQNLRKPNFLKYWTRKEAFGKARGLGINFTMREHDFSNAQHRFAYQCDDESNWLFQQIQLEPDLIACVVRESDQAFECKLFTLNQA